MKKIVFFAMFTAFVVACDNKPKDQEMTKTEQTETNYTLIGKEAVLKYPELTAEVKYISENQLHWKTTDSKGNQAEGTENLSYKQLNGHLFFLNWIEQDGTTVSQVIDLKENKVTAYLSFADEKGRGGRAAEFLEGSVTLK